MTFIENKMKLGEMKTLYAERIFFLGLFIILLTSMLLSVFGILKIYLELQKILVITPEIIVEVDTSHALRCVSKSYLSVALDSSLFRKDRMQKLIGSGELYTFTRPLSPAFLRVGGTASDVLFFDRNEPSVESENTIFYRSHSDCTNCEDETEEHNIDNITMTGKSWLQLNQFSKNSSLDLIFDLNVLIRFNNSWNPTNAEEILKYSEDIACNTTWQLGNEPNSFPHVFGTSVPAAQLGLDFKNLRSLLDKYPSCYKHSLLVGPDVTNPKLKMTPSQDYLHQFLQTAKTSINAVSWHQYYFNGRTATLNDFLNPQIFDQLKESINIIKSIVQRVSPNIPLWLSETSSAWGGGAPGLSDRYVASFIWIDKLGLGAQLGLDVIVRQTLCGGSYALVDCKTFQPNPDWWVSILHKKLVGEVVLNIKYSSEELVRLYAHCSPSDTGLSSIVIFGINMEDKPVNLKTEGLTGKGFAYIINTASDLYARSVVLNGKILELNPDHTLPSFEPIIVSLDEVIEIPALAIVFLVTQKQYTFLCNKNCNDYVK